MPKNEKTDNHLYDICFYFNVFNKLPFAKKIR